MNVLARWLFGAFVMLLGLIGLYLAANAKDGTIYFSGLAIFVTCLLYVLLQIKLAYDQPKAHDPKGQEAGSGQSG